MTPTEAFEKLVAAIESRLDNEVKHIQERLGEIESRLDKLDGALGLARWFIPLALAATAIALSKVAQ